jgi:hypothetical protein
MSPPLSAIFKRLINKFPRLKKSFDRSSSSAENQQGQDEAGSPKATNNLALIQFNWHK